MSLSDSHATESPEKSNPRKKHCDPLRGNERLDVSATQISRLRMPECPYSCERTKILKAPFLSSATCSSGLPLKIRKASSRHPRTTLAEKMIRRASLDHLLAARLEKTNIPAIATTAN